MDSVLSHLTTKRYLMLMNICVLAIHVSLIIIFSRARVKPMVYVNIANVLCYCVCFFLVVKEHVRGYVLVNFAAILIHTFLAIHYVGDNAGFQMYFLGCMSIVLFAHYFSVHIGIKPINGPILSAICCVMYIFTIVYAQRRAPLYPLSYTEQFRFRVFNTFLVFLFILTFFSLLALVASRNERELVRETQHDNLTGLFNRRYLTQYMNTLQQTKDLTGHWLAIIDIDDFKLFNDQYGHLCGDYVLRSVADVIHERCEQSCTVCRWGGEEFLVIGEGSDDESAALLESIRAAMADREFVYNGTRHFVTVTIGAAHYRDGQSLDAWINMADTRLYTGKQAGKNRTVSGEL